MKQEQLSKRRNIRGEPKSSAFTLVEMIIGIIIIGVLAGLATLKLAELRDRADTEYLTTAINMMDRGMEKYVLLYNTFPTIWAENPEERVSEILYHLQDADLIVQLEQEFGMSKEEMFAALTETEIENSAILDTNKRARKGLPSGDPEAKEILVLPVESPIVFPSDVVLTLNDPETPNYAYYYDSYWKPIEVAQNGLTWSSTGTLTPEQSVELMQNLEYAELTKDDVSRLINENINEATGSIEEMAEYLIDAINNGGNEFLTEAEAIRLLEEAIALGDSNTLNSLDLSELDLTKLSETTLGALVRNPSLSEENLIAIVTQGLLENNSMLTNALYNTNLSDYGKNQIALNLIEDGFEGNMNNLFSRMDYVAPEVIDAFVTSYEAGNMDPTNYLTGYNLSRMLESASEVDLTATQVNDMVDILLEVDRKDGFYYLGKYDDLISEENKQGIIDLIKAGETRAYSALESHNEDRGLTFTAAQMQELVDQFPVTTHVGARLLQSDNLTSSQLGTMVTRAIASKGDSDLMHFGDDLLDHPNLSSTDRTRLIDLVVTRNSNKLGYQMGRYEGFTPEELLRIANSSVPFSGQYISYTIFGNPLWKDPAYSDAYNALLVKATNSTNNNFADDAVMNITTSEQVSLVLDKATTANINNNLFKGLINYSTSSMTDEQVQQVLNLSTANVGNTLTNLLNRNLVSSLTETQENNIMTVIANDPTSSASGSLVNSISRNFELSSEASNSLYNLAENNLDSSLAREVLRYGKDNDATIKLFNDYVDDYVDGLGDGSSNRNYAYYAGYNTNLTGSQMLSLIDKVDSIDPTVVDNSYLRNVYSTVLESADAETQSVLTQRYLDEAVTYLSNNPGTYNRTINNKLSSSVNSVDESNISSLKTVLTSSTGTQFSSMIDNFVVNLSWNMNDNLSDQSQVELAESIITYYEDTPDATANGWGYQEIGYSGITMTLDQKERLGAMGVTIH